jgi:prolyl oligopeptidase
VKYPAVMFISGDFDTRVDPLHARKMAARMQAATASGRPVLLKYDTKSGHSGGKPVNQQIDDDAAWIGFLLDEVGVAPVQASQGQ